MANLSAETKTIKEVFQREYLIPEYQRPYSWEQDECEQLVEDIASFYKDDTESQYFLGCMVITKGHDCRGAYVVRFEQMVTGKFGEKRRGSAKATQAVF